MRFYRRVLAYFRPDAGKIGLLLLLIGLGTLCGMLQVWPLAILVDAVIAAEPKEAWMHRLFLGFLPDDRFWQIVSLALAAVVLRLIQEILGMVRSLLNFRIGHDGLLRVRCDLYRKLQALSIGYHNAQPQGDALYRLNSDTTGIHGVLNVFISVAVAALTLCVLVSVMASRSGLLTLLALAVAPPLLVANLWFGRTFRRCTHEAKSTDSAWLTTVQRALVTIGLMQAYGREEDEFRRFHTAVRDNTSAWFRFHWQQSLYGLTIGAIFGIGAALMLGIGGYLVHRDQFIEPVPGGLTAGDLVVFLAYLGMLYDPLCRLTGAGASMQEGAAGAQRVFDVLDREPVVADAPDARPLPCQPRTLRLENVGFEYAPGPRVLTGVNAAIRPGEMVAFVGASGVGKTSLLNLLPRFYDPTLGKLMLDGIDVRDVKLKDLRRHIALVLQDSVLLPASVAENIAYGRPSATAAEISRAAKLAGADAFIEQLAEGYAAPVLEGGKNLSGGQRQRIAIARALLTEAPILIFDEPTSALDPEHEKRITQTLRDLKGKRTIIVVSHRLTTVVDCDRIFVLHAGRIVETGTHAELLDRRGHYHELARLQMLPGAPAGDDDDGRELAAALAGAA